MTSFADSFPALRDEGLGVVDVGARGGISGVIRPVAALCDVVGVEPDPEEARRLSEAGRGAIPWRSLTYLPYALGAADGERLLYLCRSGGASSFYQPNRAFVDRFPEAERFDLIGTRLVPVRSLDGLRGDPQAALPRHIRFLKVDTQGSELEVLRGAEQVLRQQAVAVQVEVLFAPIYESPPTFHEVDTLLTSCGFTLFKLRRLEWVRRAAAGRAQVSAGQLVLGDALYLKDPLDPARGAACSQPAELEAVILLAILYDLHDVALEVLAAPSCDGWLARDSLRRCVARRGRRLNSFRERLRVARASYGASGGWRHYAVRWARGDDNFYAVQPDPGAR